MEVHFVALCLLWLMTLRGKVEAQGRILWNGPPTGVVAGRTVILQWIGGDGSSVTIALLKGTPGNLETISTLTDNATGFLFYWIPDVALPDANDYVLLIKQGDQGTDFTDPITLSGGSSSSTRITAESSVAESSTPTTSLATTSTSPPTSLASPNTTVAVASSSSVRINAGQSTTVPGGADQSDSKSGLKQKDKIVIGLVVPISVAVLGLCGYYTWRHIIVRKAAAAGAAARESDNVANGAQPYLQKKGELEAREKKIYELDAHAKTHEIGQGDTVFETRGEDAIHQLEGEDVSRNQQHEQKSL